MTRITSTVFIVLILMNGSAGIMAATGLSADLGVDIAPGISESINNKVDKIQEGFSPSSGLGQTLFTLFIAATLVFEVIVSAVTAAPIMLTNFGIPGEIVYPLFTPIYVISVLELIYMATGRDGV